MTMGVPDEDYSRYVVHTNLDIHVSIRLGFHGAH